MSSRRSAVRSGRAACAAGSAYPSTHLDVVLGLFAVRRVRRWCRSISTATRLKRKPGHKEQHCGPKTKVEQHCGPKTKVGNNPNPNFKDRQEQHCGPKPRLGNDISQTRRASPIVARTRYQDPLRLAPELTQHRLQRPVALWFWRAARGDVSSQLLPSVL